MSLDNTMKSSSAFNAAADLGGPTPGGFNPASPSHSLSELKVATGLFSFGNGQLAAAIIPSLANVPVVQDNAPAPVQTGPKNTFN